jgi:feruloyl esterase
MYTGLKTRSGQVAAYPLLRGSEMDWEARSIGTARQPLGSNFNTGSHTVMYMVYADPDFDVLHYSPERVVEVENSPTAKVYEAKEPDASAFLKRGGKWLLWQGFNDPGPGPMNTISYFEQAKRVSGARLGRTPAQVDQAMRLFLAPGVYHCGGGPGPDQFDLLTALDSWVETGKPPERIVATNRAKTLSRPLCPYPALPRYRGTGDSNDEKNFVCR